MFWGLFFVGLGLLMLINYTLGLHLPVFRILFSVGVIYLGVSILLGSFGMKVKKVSSNNEAVLSSAQFSLGPDLKSEKDRQYSTVFGEGELDLTDLDLSKGSVDLELNTVFGETRLIVRKDTPLRIRSTSVFGKSTMPGRNENVLGKFDYKTDGLAADAAALNIESNVVFGSFSVIQK